MPDGGPQVGSRNPPTTQWHPAAAFRPQGQAGHLSAYVGRTAPARSLRLQARAGQAPLAALPRFSCSRTRNSPSSRGTPSCSAPPTSSRNAARAAPSSASSCRTSRRGRRHRHRPIHVHRSVQPRAGRAVPLHRLIAQRRGGDGLVDHLRAGLRKPGPARVRRLDQRRNRSDRRQGPLEHRLSAQRLPGRAMPDRRRSRSCTSAIPREWTGPIAGARSMRSGSSTSTSSPSSAIPRP